MFTTFTSSADTLHGWELLAPIPDPVGFGGMFAAPLNGQLVAGGGSQFRDKPNWLQGEKVFSDRIFTLADPAAKWVESATRLPAKMGHFATAATSDAIYLVGGINATGCLAPCWQLRAQGGGFQFTPLPDFPHAIGYAAGAIANGRLYVIGGLPEPTSKSPTVETWSLELAKISAGAKWTREPDLPAPGVFVSGVASDGRHVYVFGGMTYDAEGKATPSKRMLRFNPARTAWETLADLPEPRVGSASPAPVVAGEKLFVIGGYAEVFPGPAREYPGFRDQTLYYDLKRNTWENGPTIPKAEIPNRDSPGDPGPAPMIAAPCAVWQNRAVVVGGEVRASVRTPSVVAWPLGAKPR
jgi:N-acetylneuraminic acid mutarotase